jgi:DNA (cytosine-5)-methyltransferase 1
VTFGSLFSGIGGMDLGLERAGLKCVWQVEIDGYCQRVLRKHWPDVPKWDDVRTFPPKEGDWNCDLIAGGFPCQDISNAGTRVGISGERSGLWSEFARIVGVVRPELVLVENVPEIVIRGLGTVLADLAEMGFDAEWACLPAAAFGAPHIRERFFLVAYAQSQLGKQRGRRRHEARRENCEAAERPEKPSATHAYGIHAQARVFGPSREIAALPLACWGTDQPGVDRASYGTANRVDRITGLGNAVVPQVAEWIGRRILAASPAG